LGLSAGDHPERGGRAFKLGPRSWSDANKLLCWDKGGFQENKGGKGGGERLARLKGKSAGAEARKAQENGSAGLSKNTEYSVGVLKQKTGKPGKGDPKKRGFKMSKGKKKRLLLRVMQIAERGKTGKNTKGPLGKKVRVDQVQQSIGK